jgi:PIN domain nuclease of toxin-antitoxin system
MKVLLDTHVLAWLLIDPDLIPASMMADIESSPELFVSAASAWEMAIKYEKGRWPEVVGLLGSWDESLGDAGIKEVPIAARHGRMAAALNSDHRDPFDRVIVAQAIALDARLATVDATIVRDFAAIISAQSQRRT